MGLFVVGGQPGRGSLRPREAVGGMSNPHNAALVGKAGEALVAAELLRRHIDVAYPAHDSGVDLIAYRSKTPNLVVPIQVKARSATCFEFQKSWFHIEGLVLIQVWHVITSPQFFIFGDLHDVEEALGPSHVVTASWAQKGTYTVTSPTKAQLARMISHRDQWDRILMRLAD